MDGNNTLLVVRCKKDRASPPKQFMQKTNDALCGNIKCGICLQ
jgi:hypothetical protein